MANLIALTRAVPASITHCELTHLPREPIDLLRARAQHAAYEQALAEAGCAIERLPPEDGMADSVFVEDTAIVVDELAVITRPGAHSRRGETSSVATALARHRSLAWIEAPATIDGGDVLRLGRRIYIGQSTRTEMHAVEQLTRMLGPLGYDVRPVAVTEVLHLKSAATALADDLALVNPRWVDPSIFPGSIAVDESEPYAANVLRIGDVVFAAAAFPRTNERLREAGFDVRALEASELAKAEGALTCCSILVLPSGA